MTENQKDDMNDLQLSENVIVLGIAIGIVRIISKKIINKFH